MAEAAKKPLSYADYLAVERATDIRHEFLDGEVWAMVGGSPRHSAVKSNLLGLIFGELARGPCRPYDSDLKVRVPDTGLATYPDLAVVCGDPLPDRDDPNAVTNPVVLVEVLSPSTEAWDRGDKWWHFRQIGTLRHYLLVSPDHGRVEHYQRLEGGTWRYTEHSAGDTLRLEAVGCELQVDAIFERLPPPTGE